MSAIATALAPAWANPVHDAQTSFRIALNAFAEPGLVLPVPVDLTAPAPLDVATVALALTLADYETPVWLAPGADVPAVQDYLRFHCGCPTVTDRASAIFAILPDLRLPLVLSDFAQGDSAYPDRSATLWIQVPSLETGPRRMLSGPGIKKTRAFHAAGLPDDFDAQWMQNVAGFPLGVDIIFCCGNQIAALPRTTHISRTHIAEAPCM